MQSRRDESPQLVEPDRGREHESAHGRDLDLQGERVGHTGECERDMRTHDGVEGLAQNVEDRRIEAPGNDHASGNGQQAADDSGAELAQVLGQRHGAIGGVAPHRSGLLIRRLVLVVGLDLGLEDAQ